MRRIPASPSPRFRAVASGARVALPSGRGPGIRAAPPRFPGCPEADSCPRGPPGAPPSAWPSRSHRCRPRRSCARRCTRCGVAGCCRGASAAWASEDLVAHFFRGTGPIARECAFVAERRSRFRIEVLGGLARAIALAKPGRWIDRDGHYACRRRDLGLGHALQGLARITHPDGQRRLAAGLVRTEIRRRVETDPRHRGELAVEACEPR